MYICMIQIKLIYTGGLKLPNTSYIVRALPYFLQNTNPIDCAGTLCFTQSNPILHERFVIEEFNYVINLILTKWNFIIL